MFFLLQMKHEKTKTQQCISLFFFKSTVIFWNRADNI